jgi:hypothetical protein
MEKLLTSVKRGYLPFFVSRDGKGNQWIACEEGTASTIDLFSESSKDLARRAMDFYPSHRFNPYFGLFMKEIVGTVAVDRSGTHQDTATSVTSTSHMSSWNRHRPFLNQPGIHAICRDLNVRIERMHAATQTNDFRQDAKSFRAAAKGIQQGVMRYAAHLIDGAPTARVVYLVLRAGQLDSPEPIDFDTLRGCRDRLFRYLTRKLQQSSYLGYSLVLKHNAQHGYFLAGFIYLMDDTVKSVHDVAAMITRHWKAEISGNQGSCAHSVLPKWPGRETQHAVTLGSATALTDTDLYLQVVQPGPSRLRRWWSSQSPVGKLTPSTQRKKRVDRAKQRKLCQDALLEDAVEEALSADEQLRLIRWKNKMQAVAHKRSESRKRSARTRAEHTPTARGNEHIPELGNGSISVDAPVPASGTTRRRRDRALAHSLVPKDESRAPADITEPADEPRELRRRVSLSRVIDADGNYRLIEVEVRRKRPKPSD